MEEFGLIGLIKNIEGIQVKEPDQKYVVQKLDGSMYEAADFREMAAIVIGNEYLDCEAAETEWLMRTNVAKMVGLSIIAEEDDAKTIIYDERIGKIPYSYTDTNPDYKIPQDPELIRIECDETFVLTLHKIKYLRVWEQSEDTYKVYQDLHNVDLEIGKQLERFRDKIQNIPLHERL